MRSLGLAKRNLKGMWRDPLSLGLNLALPAGLLLVLQAVGGAIGEKDAPFLTPANLAPGAALFGFVMVMFSSAMVLSRDRETAFLSRLLTAPLRPSDFVAAYSLPYVAVAVVQALMVFAIAAFWGLEITGNAGLVVLLLFSMSILYIGLGMAMGSLLGVVPLSGAYTAVLLLTIFGGAWMDLEAIGGAFLTVANALPFAHALDATRDVMIDGAGLGAIATDLYWVLGYTVVVGALAVLAFRRRMLE